MNKLNIISTLTKALISYKLLLKKCPYLPLRIWVEPTNLCNLKCRMCSQSNLNNSVRGYMEITLFKTIINEIKDFAYDVKLFLGGESLLHPEIITMIDYVKNSGLNCLLNTNASMLNSELSKSLVNTKIDKITFSFEWYDKKVYERMRRPAQFEIVLEKIKNFLSIRRELNKVKPKVVIQAILFDGYSKN